MQDRFCVVYLLHGKGLEDFLENSLLSLRRSGFAMDVVIYASAEVLPLATEIAARYQARAIETGHENIEGEGNYVPYGTREFNRINLKKWDLIIDTLSTGYDCVIYSDVDIAFTSDFTSYLKNVMRLYSCGIQSESQNRFPPVYCAGFMFFTKGAMELLEELRGMGRSFADTGNDQDLLNIEIARRPHVAKEIMLLPEGLFQNGLYFQTYQDQNFAPMRGKLQPFMFHANFVVGISAKRDLLKRTGNWHLP